MSKTEQSNAWQVAVALDKGKSSHIAFKWALDNVITTGQALTLVHVNTKHSSGNQEDATANIARDVFLPFRCFCTRKNVECREVVLEDTDVTKAIVEFVTDAAIDKLVIGLSSKSGFVRSFRNTDISAAIYKSLPDFCTIYIIYKGKVSSMRNAVRPAPAVFPLQTQMQGLSSVKPDPLENNHKNSMKLQSEAASAPWNLQKENESIRSPFTRGTHASTTNAYGEMTLGSDISYASTGRKSIERSYPTKFSNISDSFNRSLDRSFDSPHKSLGAYPTGNGFSSLSYESSSSPTKKDVEAEIQRLRLELKQTMDMYSTARKEALTAKQRAMELQRWKMVEEQRLEEAAPTLEGEKAKHMAATETGEASKKISESEIQKRISAEMKAVKEAEKDFDALSHTNLRYRRYTIKEIEEATNHYAEDRKIGEGGYGPVYRGYLDHTPVAIKVLRSDADQGRSQFQQEVEILCCIRHPNMVLLLGACPEYGSLVYEYMANGSLEDRLFRRGNTPPIPWQHRFRIAAEIGTGLLFLHQTKPEPLVHRDLKPANILLDRNYVSKISDVGLARLVPQSVAENVTQYRMTATAGTFCYIDPEYQQTGMLGTKSDIYSLGIILLQLVTGKPPMGLAHYMDHAIEKGTVIEMLDRSVPDWPVEEALSLARLALKCAELRRKDRPALAAVILPELNRLRDLAEENMQYSMFGNSSHTSFVHGQVSSQDVMNGPSIIHSGYGSPRSRHSGSYMPERRLSTS